MASELVQSTETPFNPSNPVSGASGKQNIAQVFGQIADRALTKATSYADEASKTNLLQTNSMLKDVEASSKLEMLKSPGHAEVIAKNAEITAEKIKSNAVLNRSDRVSLDLAAKDTVRGLTFAAAQKSIAITNANAKYASLSAFDSTVQAIDNQLIANPEQAEKTIEAFYSSLKGQVSSGILTPVEAASLHKQLEKKVELAQHIITGIKAANLDASDINTYHELTAGNVPMNNAHLPISHDTQLHSDIYLGHLDLKQIKNKSSNGSYVSPSDFLGLKKISDVDHAINYYAGAARATGNLKSVQSWPQLRKDLALLTKTKQLSTWDEGRRDRLNNFFAKIDQPGGYERYIDSTPAGAQAAQEFAERQTVIDSSVNFGDVATTNRVKTEQHADALNEWVAKRNAIGIGAMWPDDMRQPIPLGYLNTVDDGFKKGGDVNAAIATMHLFDKNNRPYFLNHFKNDYRKALTAYEIGNLDTANDDGFMAEYLQSQQVGNLGEKEGKKSAQEKFLQLDTTGEHSDDKLKARIRVNIPDVATYLNYQPKGEALVSAKVDGALRYIKDQAAKHEDYTFKHLDDYLKRYANKMQEAYGVVTGFNFVANRHDVPLEDNEMQVLASHALNESRKALLEFKSPVEVDSIFNSTPPILVSSPGGRVEVVYPDGTRLVNKNGRPAYSHLYTEDLWRAAEHDKNIIEFTQDGKPAYESQITSFGSPISFPRQQIPKKYLRTKLDKSKIVRPLIEGNIDLENRPKVYDEKGNYETVKTITREFDGRTILLPTIINGKQLSVKEATDHYFRTGEHLGVFRSQEQADKYDEDLHRRMGWLGKNNKWGAK